MKRRCALLFLVLFVVAGQAFDDSCAQDDLVTGTRSDFVISEHDAFVILPPETEADELIPWVWYAPTFHKNLPGDAEAWMFDRFLRNGIAIAGIDVGESYGSPTGRELFQELYEELTENRSFRAKPVLLARSRGGLMLYNWAVEHPGSVGGVAGIYPVCNLASYPGIEKAAPAYEMTADELQATLAQHNPIERSASLAEAKVPIFHIHGDSDRVVPLEANTAALAENYQELEGPIEVEVVKGQGHNMWRGWFESERLVAFVIENARK